MAVNSRAGPICFETVFAIGAACVAGRYVARVPLSLSLSVGAAVLAVDWAASQSGGVKWQRQAFQLAGAGAGPLGLAYLFHKSFKRWPDIAGLWLVVMLFARLGERLDNHMLRTTLPPQPFQPPRPKPVITPESISTFRQRFNTEASLNALAKTKKSLFGQLMATEADFFHNGTRVTFKRSDDKTTVKAQGLGPLTEEEEKALDAILRPSQEDLNSLMWEAAANLTKAFAVANQPLPAESFSPRRITRPPGIPSWSYGLETAEGRRWVIYRVPAKGLVAEYYRAVQVINGKCTEEVVSGWARYNPKNTEIELQSQVFDLIVKNYKRHLA